MWLGLGMGWEWESGWGCVEEPHKKRATLIYMQCQGTGDVKESVGLSGYAEGEEAVAKSYR